MEETIYLDGSLSLSRSFFSGFLFYEDLIDLFFFFFPFGLYNLIIDFIF